MIENPIIKELTCNMNTCDGEACWALAGSSLHYVGLPVVRNVQLGVDDGDRVQSAAATLSNFNIDIQYSAFLILEVESLLALSDFKSYSISIPSFLSPPACQQRWDILKNFVDQTI